MDKRTPIGCVDWCIIAFDLHCFNHLDGGTGEGQQHSLTKCARACLNVSEDISSRNDEEEDDDDGEMKT